MTVLASRADASADDEFSDKLPRSSGSAANDITLKNSESF
jgi:hypothetical protein